MTPRLSERFRARIPSIPRFVAKVAEDPRQFSYALLPVFPHIATRDRIAGILAAMRPKTPGFAPSDEARQLDRLLRADGITPRLTPPPETLVAGLRRHFEETPCSDPYRPHLGRFRYDAPPSPETNMGYFALEDIVSAPGLLYFLNSPLLLETAELFLGCKPLLDNIGCWWSFGGRPAAKGTQRYHRDLDSWRGFKVFLYLLDVGPDCGPHVFMRGSQRSDRLATGKAMSDAAVREAFGAENEIVLAGPAGTWFLADTWGFHKGLLPENGRRLMVTAQYTVNRTPHLPRKPVIATPDRALDPGINRLLLS